MIDLYRQHFVDKQFERLDLFEKLRDQFGIQRVLYPGSFVHITPSFIFPDVVYVDSDKRAARFFKDEQLAPFVAKNKRYSEESIIQFYSGDYREGFAEPDASFDLLVSQYAGFVGQACKQYLKKGGLLLANNSHGDAGVAALDEDYQLTAVVNLRNNKHTISNKSLEAYFIPKSDKTPINQSYLLELKRGIGYQKTASAYLFLKK